MKLFTYTRTEGEKTFIDSFNLDKVVRTVELEDGKTLVLLDDLHERVQEVPVAHPKTGKITGMRRERNTYQSEIYLNEEDGKRLLNVTNA